MSATEQAELDDAGKEGGEEQVKLLLLVLVKRHVD
jgi:hypothetical protein